MKDLKINTKIGLLRSLFFVCFIAFVTLSSFTVQRTIHAVPTFLVFSDNGEVDLTKGISSKTKRLFVKVTMDDKGLKARVSKTKTILVSGGQGTGVKEAGEKIDLADILTKKNLVDEEPMLLIEIVEYQIKNKEDIVEAFELRKPIFIKIPLITAD